MDFMSPDLSKYKLIDKQFKKVHCHYTILKRLGSGSFGVVYKINSKLNGKLFALKKVDLSKRKNMIGFREPANLSFINDLLTALNKQKLYHDSWTEEGYMFIKMKLFEGNITDLYGKCKFVDRNVFFDLCLQLISFTSLIHKNGYVHLDIKPGRFKREYTV